MELALVGIGVILGMYLQGSLARARNKRRRKQRRRKGYGLVKGW